MVEPMPIVIADARPGGTRTDAETSFCFPLASSSTWRHRPIRKFPCKWNGHPTSAVSHFLHITPCYCFLAAGLDDGGAEHTSLSLLSYWEVFTRMLHRFEKKKIRNGIVCNLRVTVILLRGKWHNFKRDGSSILVLYSANFKAVKPS